MNTACAVYSFPCGNLRICCNERAVTEISRTELPVGGEASPLCDETARELTEYFGGTRREFDVPVETHGTEFQERVWAALRDIPYGETRSYKDIAAAVGNEKACRAVGGANNKNPVCIITPCHRVIGASGAMIGYAGGLDMKKLLLELERKNSSEG